MSGAKKMVPKRRFKEFLNAGDWEQRNLGDFVKIDTGKLDANAMQAHGQYDFYTSGVQKYKIDCAAFEGPAITIAGNGATVGYMHLADGLFNAYQRTYVLSQFTEDRQYLFYEIGRQLPKKIFKEARTGSIPYIVMDMLESLQLSISTSQENKKIAQFLSFIDKTITLHQRKLDKLQATKKALLQEMFPEEGQDKPKRRFKGFTDAWEQCKLSELATMNARIGWQNLRTSEFLDSGDYLLITGTDFDNGRIKYSTCHYVEKKRFDQDTKIQLSTGSILITKDGTLGKVALVEELPKPATLNAGVFNVRVKDDTLLSYKYLYHYLKAPFLMKYVTVNATGGTIKHLNQSILVDFPIPIAEKHEQDKIAKLLDSIESIITLHQRKLDKLKNLKQAYLNEMFV